MRLVKPVLLAILVVALATYVLDCSAMTTPQQATQCCNSMPCSSQGHHSEDCCKTMPSMHAPFVQSSSIRYGISYSSVVVVVLAAFDESHSVDSSARTIAEHFHAPPFVYSATLSPLRV
jgi:hypothetical protein